MTQPELVDEMEVKIEKAFYSGHEAGIKLKPSLVAFLNHKMEQRL